MKGYMKWANEWRDKYSSPGEFEESGQQEAFVAGFKCGRDHAASLIEGFRNPKLETLPILIRAIGTADIYESGNPPEDTL